MDATSQKSPRVDDTEGTIARLLRRLGYDSFRPGQERVVRDLLKGRDVLAVLPTGAGKSLVFQLASQLLPGVTLVVSPLLALMKDQVDSAAELGLEAGQVSSAQSEAVAEEAIAEATRGAAKLLYVTPERLANPEFRAELDRMRVSLLVVDEAHCISEWGHDFRPSYLALGEAARRIGRPVLLALTATATPWVRREIVERLGLRDPDLVVRDVDRPNLFFEVRRVEEADEERRVLRELLFPEAADYPAEVGRTLDAAMRGAGIVYTATTREAEETADWLREWGIAADYYHGQRRKAERARVQEAFMRGEVRVIAATSAFGLGVDKSNVRFVIHRNVPGSVEEYYQEAGRAGRDGVFARCTLVYRPADLGRAAFLSAGSRLTRADLRKARAALWQHPGLTAEELRRASGLNRAAVARTIELLRRQGIVDDRDGRLRPRVPDFDPKAVSLRDEERRKAYEGSRVEMMRGYAELETCRRGYLLNYFGEEFPAGSCGNCDIDLRLRDERVAVAEAAPAPSPFAIGERVVHARWGPGVVERTEDDRVIVLFAEVGYKTLASDLVLERGLLARAEGA